MSLAEHRTRLVTSRNRCLVVLLVDIYQKDSSETSLFAAQIFRIEIAYLARHDEGLCECFSEVQISYVNLLAFG